MPEWLEAENTYKKPEAHCAPRQTPIAVNEAPRCKWEADQDTGNHARRERSEDGRKDYPHERVKKEMEAETDDYPLRKRSPCDQNNNEDESEHGWDVHPEPGVVGEIERTVGRRPIRGSNPAEALVQEVDEVDWYEAQ